MLPIGSFESLTNGYPRILGAQVDIGTFESPGVYPASPSLARLVARFIPSTRPSLEPAPLTLSMAHTRPRGPLTAKGAGMINGAAAPASCSRRLTANSTAAAAQPSFASKSGTSFSERQLLGGFSNG